MIKTLLVAGVIYVGLLILFSQIAKVKEKTTKNYFMAGSNLGSVLGLFTFAATLFSTFTILGMPDFFRQHGIGAWIFLAFSDAVMVFGIIWLGTYFRKKGKTDQYYGMAGFMRDQYTSSMAGFVVFLGAFIFLIPYVAIQIRGVAIFLNEAFPQSLPLWIWAAAIVVIMLMYSEIGGLKAIIYSDTLQGILLLIVIWIIGITCLNSLGGIKSMFAQIETQQEALLSVPGPKGLFDFQFLFGSMVAIALLPFTQPQVSTRLIIMKDQKSLFRMAIGLGTFAILVILPTLFIGMYGAIHYADAPTSTFLGNALIQDQNGFIGAMVLLGLIAAAISTADSQIFALGGETRSLLKGEDKKMIGLARISIVIFAVLALIFALLSSDELVLLARTSFAGTALLAPLIFTGLFYKDPKKLNYLPVLTLVAIIILILSQLKVVGNNVIGIRMDLFLLGILALIAVVGIMVNNKR
jgi:SSS family solute:Na+ symporter